MVVLPCSFTCVDPSPKPTWTIAMLWNRLSVYLYVGSLSHLKLDITSSSLLHRVTSYSVSEIITSKIYIDRYLLLLADCFFF